MEIVHIKKKLKSIFEALYMFCCCIFTCFSVVSQHSSTLLNTSGKVAQVVVAVDQSRRTVQSAYVVDGGSLSTAAGHRSAVQASVEPTSTASQTIMSPRPSILRKRPHDVYVYKTLITTDLILTRLIRL